MPTTAANTFQVAKLEPARACGARTEAVPFGASLTLAKGTCVARKASDNKWYAYSDVGSGGIDVMRGILQYSIVTDSSGNVFYGTSAVSEQGQSELTAPIYVSGDFFVADLTGLDANGLADVKGWIVYGDDLTDTANAMIHIG